MLLVCSKKGLSLHIKTDQRINSFAQPKLAQWMPSYTFSKQNIADINTRSLETSVNQDQSLKMYITQS